MKNAIKKGDVSKLKECINADNIDNILDAVRRFSSGLDRSYMLFGLDAYAERARVHYRADE